MFKMFRYLKTEKLSVFLIVILLVLQAYCDLALPQYTSQIVDVGIAQSGIEDAGFHYISKETMDSLQIFMTENEKEYVNGFYETNEDGYLELTDITEEEKIELVDAFKVPVLMLMGMSQSEQKMDAATLLSMYNNGMITPEQISTMKEQGLKAIEGISDTMLEQQTILFVKAEYEALDIDLGKMQTNYLLVTGAKMLGLSIAMMVSAILVGLLAARTAARIGCNLRGSVFKKVVGFSNQEIDHFSTASLITRSTNDIQQVQMVTVMMLRMVVYAPILGIGGVIKVMATRTGMGWIIGAAVGVLMMIVAILMMIALPKFKKMQSLIDRLNLVSREILTGIFVVRAFGREKHEEKRFEVANTDLMDTQLFTNRVMTFMMPMMMLIMNGVTVMIIWFGAKGIELGNLQVGDMMAFITYTMQIVLSFLILTMISIFLPRAAVAAGRINEILEMPDSIQDAHQTLDYELNNVKGEIAFENVSFAYPGAKEDALSNLTFTAKPGETTAIIGSTGSGKSTLIQLIPRLYDVREGKITLDGIDIRELSQKKLHDVIGYVPQKGVLFSGTIASNITFAGEHITEEAMKDAAKVAQAEAFISEKEQQYESQISQGGTNVSGGQKQRLSIARAIAKNPPVYLFDDSFSALDYKTDVTLRKALKEKTVMATVIIVAQRISTVLHAEKIIVLEEGKIVGMGNHETLLNTCEQYMEIAKSQLSEAELKGGLSS